MHRRKKQTFRPILPKHGENSLVSGKTVKKRKSVLNEDKSNGKGTNRQTNDNPKEAGFDSKALSESLNILLNDPLNKPAKIVTSEVEANALNHKTSKPNNDACNTMDLNEQPGDVVFVSISHTDSAVKNESQRRLVTQSETYLESTEIEPSKTQLPIPVASSFPSETPPEPPVTSVASSETLHQQAESLHVNTLRGTLNTTVDCKSVSADASNKVPSIEKISAPKIRRKKLVAVPNMPNGGMRRGRNTTNKEQSAKPALKLATVNVADNSTDKVHSNPTVNSDLAADDKSTTISENMSNVEGVESVAKVFSEPDMDCNKNSADSGLVDLDSSCANAAIPSQSPQKQTNSHSSEKFSAPVAKSRMQLVREQFGYEEKGIRQRNALKKMKNLDKDQTAEGQDRWTNLVRDSFLMSDLIYCNPPKESAKELGLQAALRKMKDKLNKSATATSETPTKPVEPAPEKSAQENAVIAPQIRINEDGSVVLDEESLVINSSRPDTVVHETPAIYENDFGMVTSASFRRQSGVKRSFWTEKQTKKFYEALRIVGADFSLMSAMFRNRNDYELRRKFHLERRKHSVLVDEALKQQHLSKWTNDMFRPDSSSDEEITPLKKKRRKTKLLKKMSPEHAEACVNTPNLPVAEVPGVVSW